MGPRMARRSILAVVLTVLALASSVSARQATPVAMPTAIDPGRCTVEPRPMDQMRELVQAGLPTIVAFMAGTPVASGDATPQMAETDEDPADEATGAAVTEVVLQFVACSRAGDLAAVANLLTEEGASYYLGFGFLSFRAAITGDTGTPTADVDPNQIDLYLGAIQMRAPIPPEFLPTFYGIESVTQLADGRVRVILLLATGAEEPAKSSLLRQEEGRYRIIFGRETGREERAP